MEKYYVYDIETYLELFSFSIVRADGKHKASFRVDKYKNDLSRIYKCLDYLEDQEFTLVGFNNINFDSPILHSVIKNKRN